MAPALIDRVFDALPDTQHRVTRHTSARVNARIQEEIEDSVRHHAKHPNRIDRRLAELDREWDIERTLEANAAALSLLGIGLGSFVDRRFLALPAFVAGFLLQHALQGWCPPVVVFRRLGVRTTAEIQAERTALKALRGDFERIPEDGGKKGKGAKAKARAALRASWR